MRDENLKDSNNSTGEDEIESDVFFTDYGFEEDANEDEAINSSPAKTLIKYVLVFLTLLSFITLAIGPYWPFNFPDLRSVMTSSSALKKELPPELLNTVVRIEADIVSGTSRQRQGTGFNISPTGVIVTNYHVIADALLIKVYFGQAQPLYAVEWSGNPELDLALLFLNAADLATLSLSDADPTPRQEIMIIGNPLGINQVAITGVVLDKVRVDRLAAEAVAIKAPIYSGNSGSPVLDDRQQVIGVVFGTIRNNASIPEDIIALAMPVSQLAAWADEVSLLSDL